eukprot:6194649-Pleurochrysis_carterae.AAC.6
MAQMGLRVLMAVAAANQREQVGHLVSFPHALAIVSLETLAHAQAGRDRSCVGEDTMLLVSALRHSERVSWQLFYTFSDHFLMHLIAQACQLHMTGAQQFECFSETCIHKSRVTRYGLPIVQRPRHLESCYLDIDE